MGTVMVPMAGFTFTTCIKDTRPRDRRVSVDPFQPQFSRENLSSGCHQVRFRPFPIGSHEIPPLSQERAIYVDLRTFTLTVPRDTRTSHNPKAVGSSPTPATKKSYLLAGLL